MTAKLPELISASDMGQLSLRFHLAEKTKVQFSFFLRSSHGPVSQLYLFFILVFGPAAEMDSSKCQRSKMSQSYIQKNGQTGAFVWK